MANEKENQLEKPLLSIVVIISDIYHLASWTLDSIFEQTENCFEVIVVMTHKARSAFSGIRSYTDKIAQIIYAEDESTIAFLMNLGLAATKGKYIQFFLSSEIFLSKHILSKVFSNMQKEPSMDLYYGLSLIRREGAPLEILDEDICYDILKRGIAPRRVESCFFKKEFLHTLGGFDSRNYFKEGLDIFSKIVLQESYKATKFPFVIADFELQKRFTTQTLRQAWESVLIVYRNFGLLNAFMLFVFRNHFKILKLWLRNGFRYLVRNR